MKRSKSSSSNQLVRQGSACLHLVVVFLMVCVVIAGTVGNFVSRMRAELLGKDNYASSVPDAPLHLIFHLLCLSIAIGTGCVSKEQLRRTFRFGRTWADTGVWKYMVLAAVNDTLNYVTGLASQPYLTTLMMSLMDQATTPFTFVCSLALLGTRYTLFETLAVVEVAASAVACVLVARGTNPSDNSAFWAAFAAVTTCFAALAIVLKEMAFREFQEASPIVRARSAPKLATPCTAATRAAMAMPLLQTLKQDGGPPHEDDPHFPRPRGDTNPDLAASDLEGERLSVFVMGSTVGLVSVIVCVPAALLNQLVTSGDADVFALIGSIHHIFSDWHVTRVYLAATLINFVFALAMLALTAKASALHAFLTLKLIVPVTALLSPLPWPIIGAKPVDSREWAVLVLMMVGVAAFRWGTIYREKHGLRHCCWPLRSPC